MNDLGEQAMHYADVGWPIFPLAPRGKSPLTSHGFKDAVADSEIVRSWWKRWPNANIGLWTRDFTVLDVDPRHGGDESLLDLTHSQHQSVMNTVSVVTGGGGAHYYFRGSTKLKTAGPGLDVKSVKGYVILPPSIHPSGKTYEWEYAPGDTPMLELPDWLTVTKDPATLKIYENGPIDDGDRNETLMRIAGRLRGIGGYIGDVDMIEAMLDAINRAYCNPPLSPHEVHGIAMSANRWQSGSDVPDRGDIAW